jgi:hypothetical protein
VGRSSLMARYMLAHRHTADECGSAFASWKGFESPLRHQPAIGSCHTGGHRLWWLVEAVDHPGAIAQLPRFVALRTEATEVSEVMVP